MELNNARIKHLCMTLQEWEGKNPTLKAGELCLVSDYPGLYKIGIEGKKWKEIPYPHAYDHNKSDISSSYLPLTGGTLAGDLQFASYGNSGERGIKAVMAANDYWGIVGRSTEDNQGILEIYTGDDGGSSTYNEIVKFSQYAGARTVESKPVKEFVVFDKSGNTSIPGVVSMGSTLTLRGNRGNADVFTDFNGGRGIVIRVTDSSGVLHELGMWNNGTPNYIKGNTRYNLHHAGNLGIATSTKSGLVKSGGDITVGTDGTVSVNKSKVADNANKLGNYGLFTSSSGSPAGHVPLIGADGVMEAGCYIDFHANGDTSDYNLRLMYDEDTDK